MLLTGTSLCVPLAGLRFQSPAAAPAHPWAQRPRQTRPLAAAAATAGASDRRHHPACSAEHVCPLDGPGDSAPSAGRAAAAASSGGARLRRKRRPADVSAAVAPFPRIAGAVAAKQAQLEAASAAGGGGPKPWYKEHADAWTDLSSEQEFYAFLEGDAAGDGGGAGAGAGGDGRLVLIDFYATWCQGCKASYPALSMLAGDPALRSRVRFAKVCVDVLKPLVRRAGVKGLPAVQMYAPGSRRALATLDVPPSRVKHLRKSLEAALAHDWRSHEYRVDPNGFLVAVALTPGQIQARAADALASLDGGRGRVLPPAADAAKAAAARALEGSAASLFDRLLSTASGGGSSGSSSGGSGSDSEGSGATAASAPAAAAPLSTPASVAAPAAASAAAAAAPYAASAAAAASPAVYDEGAAEARAAWLASDPSARAAYGYGGKLDAMYTAEVGCRMRPGEHYLDHTGAGVYCTSQIRAAFEDLAAAMYGNPHSAHPSSARASAAVDDARERVLRFFGADPREYSVVFTRSATGALKTVGESFPWAPGSEYAYLRESHNSVLGVREYPLRAGGSFVALDERGVEAWLASGEASPGAFGAPHGAEGAWWARASPSPPLSSPSFPDEDDEGGAGGGNDDRSGGGDLENDGPLDVDAALAAAAGRAAAGRAATGAALATAAAAAASARGRPTFSLFAFPLEDNFAGVKAPHAWVEAVRAKSTPGRPWRVLVDAAAYVPTQPLDLSALRPDFVSLSFYKMFGYPTGLGALIVRADAAAELEPVFWGGGTVALATSADDFRVLRCRPSDRLEEGTVSFLDAAALKHGFAALERVGGMRAVRAHVAALTGWLYRELSGMRHSNGAPMVKLFGKHDAAFGEGESESESAGGGAGAGESGGEGGVQGGVFNFQALRPDGRVFSYRTVEREAAAAGLHLRSGQACAPGAALHYLGVAERELESLAGKKEGCEDDVEFLGVRRPAGAAGLLTGPDDPDGGPSGEQGAAPFAGGSGGGGGGGGGGGDGGDGAAALERRRALLQQPGPGAAPTQWVQVPLGSVRASLGYMSTFDDVYALSRFLALRFKDRAE